ncbi:Integrase [Phytophthora palmivora]|uniref:Integrase n=1 Tax=Phytophthora palmivora TaxID=4796 RepID=A0A2P4YVR6_9STRA|nr:Integrase [Phytophthora palmivora]
MTWDPGGRLFKMTKDNTEVIRTAHENRLWAFNAYNVGKNTTAKGKQTVKKSVFDNFTVTDGVEDINVWLAKGTMLKQRASKSFQNSLDRLIAKVNVMVFADLLIPGVHSRSPSTAVLVVMDGFLRYTKTYLLKSKGELDVNKCTQEYLNWVERKHESVSKRQMIVDGSDDTALVKEVLTDKG